MKKSKKTLEQKVLHFRKLVEYNEKAMGCLSDISDYTKADGKLLLKSFSQMMGYIKGMADDLSFVNDNEDIRGLAERILFIEGYTKGAVEKVSLMLDLSYKGTSVEKAVAENLIAKVETLSTKMQDPSSKSFLLANAKTPHDLIRYMHQKGVEGIFEVNDLEDSEEFMQHVKIGKGANIHLLSLDEEITKSKLKGSEKIPCKPLSALIEYYKGIKNKDEVKHGSSEAYIISLGNRIDVQISLGCHYSEIEAQIDSSKSYIKFLFRDTEDYDNSAHRTKYVRAILAKLGFKVKGKKPETKALLEGKPEGETYAKLKDLLRLCSSTNDLDLESSCLDKYPREAVTAFFKGETNILGYLQKLEKKKEKKKKKLKDL